MRDLLRCFTRPDSARSRCGRARCRGRGGRQFDRAVAFEAQRLLQELVADRTGFWSHSSISAIDRTRGANRQLANAMWNKLTKGAPQRGMNRASAANHRIQSPLGCWPCQGYVSYSDKYPGTNNADCQNSRHIGPPCAQFTIFRRGRACLSASKTQIYPSKEQFLSPT